MPKVGVGGSKRKPSQLLGMNRGALSHLPAGKKRQRIDTELGSGQRNPTHLPFLLYLAEMLFI